GAPVQYASHNTGPQALSGGMVQEHPLLSARYRARFIGILFLVCFLNLADRTVFSVVAPMIRVELKLSDTQIGMLQGLAFALLYGGLGIPVGWLAERYSRVRIIAVATAFWSAATALSGMATNFGQMLLTRVGVGTGEAGFTAPTSSLVADHFPRERRASAMSLIMLGLPIGAMVGALLAGVIAQHWGWRAVFWCFGIPGLLVACATWFGLTEPPRGLADGAGTQRAAPPPLRVAIAHLWNVASLRWIVIGGAICSIGIQGVAQFMVLYFVRSFDMPIRSAAALFGVLSGLSLAVGLVLGAFGTDKASARDPRWWVIAPAVALVLTTACFVVGFRSGTINLAVVLIGLGCLGAMIHYGPTVGLIQNLTPVNMRSSVSAVFAMLYALAGTGIGPTFVGYFSDRIAAASFAQQGYLALCRPGATAPAMLEACASAARSGLIGALTLCVLTYAVAAIFYALASRTLRADLRPR
ncbi:MAG TPA: MFS transporter, partial [Steroidobacteraceae bacterium]|nr:MFS transporter [Steroidobacteraceae bacterium]